MQKLMHQWCYPKRDDTITKNMAITGAVGYSYYTFMTINLGNNLAYILPHRGYMVLTMILVAFASGVSTVLFQTIANNKILTPSIMGLEALFILLQSIFVFYTDSFPASWLLNIGKFLLESSLLVLFSVLLYRWLFVSAKLNINLVLMVGIILGTLFKSTATLLQRLMDRMNSQFYKVVCLRLLHERPLS